ncbi:short-chain dehydrogenase/reductase SDR [Parafrankia sp. EAN1pec]|uniref:SDR family oxidoreductase n=1 Tax=Parafrankia sp. (strain EAN1pec) TaxID=298653 RepID=UPI0000542B9A|nr:short-chain dehydrogenase/reductase SDR [Frankia sp. EAN1pec]
MARVGPGNGRVAAVSGAGTGIGQVVAQKLGALGWRVAVGGRRVERLAETASLVEKAGGLCLAHELDVTDGDSVDRFFTAAEAELGTVTAVVNNAATARYGPLDDFSPEEISLEVATKLIGSLYMSRRGIQAMRAGGLGGDILFMTSSAGAQPWPYHLPYAAANAGVEHAARTLRLELEGTGIRVSTLRCGETAATDFGTLERANGRIATANEVWFRRGLLRHTGLMTPEMVADAIIAAITLPAGYQYELLTVIPTAPPGDLPPTFEDWRGAMMRAYAPSVDH